MPSPAFVSVRQASELIGICRELVRQEVKAGNLTGYKQGTKLMVSRASIDRWIAGERARHPTPAGLDRRQSSRHSHARKEETEEHARLMIS